MTVRIVTDSTANIPPATAQTLGISIVPLLITFGDEAYLDGIELDSTSLQNKLRTSKVLPHTSQPPPAAFQQSYLQLIEEGASAILSIHLSSKLSGTYQSAWIARETLPEAVKRIPIELIDSQSASIGMAPAILQAAREAGEGLELAAIKSHLLDLLSRTHFLGSLDTLDYVRHSGRLNGALAVLGETFGLKPILALKEGEIIPAGVARSHSSACARIAQQIASLGEVEQLIAGESSAGAGQQLISTLKAIYNGDIPLYQLSAILTAHTGPGTVAVAAVIKER